MILEEKYLSHFIVLTDQISLSDCRYFLKFWKISVFAIVCFQVFDVKNFEITLATLSSYFPT